MEQRVKRLEMITNRLLRRTRKTAVALITPYPISNAVFGESIKGSVLRYMFPCEGTITKGMIRFGPKLKNGAKLTVYIFDETGGIAKEFIVEKTNVSVEPNVKVVSGDCLSISIDPIDPGEALTEVWISFLWTPTVRDVEAQSFLIEELENNLQKELKEIEEEPSA